MGDRQWAREEYSKVNSKHATIKILFITSRADVGGGTKHLFDILSYTSKKNALCYVASPNEPPYADKFKKLAHQYIEIPKRKFKLRALLDLYRLVQKEKISIVHSHGRGAGIYSRMLALYHRLVLASRVFSKRDTLDFEVIHTFHGVHKDPDSFIGCIKLYVDKALAQFAHRYICVSDSERLEAIRERVGEEKKIIVVNNGIDIKAIQERHLQINIDEAKKEFEIKTSKIVVGSLSRLDIHKGYDLLLHTLHDWKKIQGDLPFHVYVAGGDDTNYDKHLADLATELAVDADISFIGSTSQPIEFLSCLDIYTSFSLGEALSYSVLEAIAIQLPCIISRVPGHNQLISQGLAHGFELNNSRDFRLKINNIIGTLKNHNGTSRLSTLKDQYSIEKMCSSNISVYNAGNL